MGNTIGTEKSLTSKKKQKFDIKMLENFLTILAPFDYGQIVSVNKKNNDENLFEAAVIEYKMSVMPNLSIINKKTRLTN